MPLTAVPVDDSTLEISNGGEPVEMTEADVRNSTSFTGMERAFLLGLFPGLAGGTCQVPRDKRP